MNSNLFATQDAFKTLLSASTDLTGVPIHLGTPLKISDLKEVVWVSGEVEDWVQEYRVSGLQATDETFVIRVHCLVTVTGNYVAARDRAKTLLQAVEDVVASNRTLSGTVVLAKVTNLALEEARADERRHQVLATLYVNCRANLVA
ncbi:hypothetical protein UFOVP1608_25 [uncultured Caudovirales phage]|uniref:Uncharacterized protein n=1 Tax=uncultured Caudovirales phage TaxID=2100421 RepID=A0A6J5STJ9_9CAUD|nr:hypothetical protein UFOVP1608_25 [uncultured Caudovirales phage]